MSLSLFAVGNYYARLINKRIDLIEKIILLIRNLKIQIEYSKLPLVELFDNALKQGDFKELRFITNTVKEIKNGEQFYPAFKRETEQFMKSSALRKNDVDLLNSFAFQLGNTDLSGQIQNCEAYIELFTQLADSLKQKAQGKIKLYNSLGLFAGFLSFVILL